MMLIGFTGRAGSGKDSAASVLVEKRNFVALSFAAPMKRALNGLFGWDISAWDDFEWKEEPKPEAFLKSPRQLAQTFGTEWGRTLVHPDIWVELAIREARMYDRVVFTDVRFPNEVAKIKKEAGLIVGVVRTDHGSTEHSGHQSETGIDLTTADVLIEAATGGVKSLQAQALAYADAMGANKNLD